MEAGQGIGDDGGDAASLQNAAVGAAGTGDQENQTDLIGSIRHDGSNGAGQVLAGDERSVQDADGHGHVLSAQEGQNCQNLAVSRQQEGGEGADQDQNDGNQQDGHGLAGAHGLMLHSGSSVGFHLGIQVGEVPGLAQPLILLVQDAAVDDTADEHTHKGGDQSVEEEHANIDIHGGCHSQRRGGGQNQREGTGGSHGDGTAVGGHRVLGFTGQNPQHGGEHDVHNIAENGNAGNEAGHSNSILGTLGANGLQNLGNDVIDAAGLIHEHAQHDTQAGDNTNAAQRRAEVVGNHVCDIGQGSEAVRRRTGGIGCEGEKTGSVSAYKKCYKSVKLCFDDTKQQNGNRNQEYEH